MSDTPLPQTPDTNIRKWIFIGVVCSIFFVIVAFFVFMSKGNTSAAGKNFAPEEKQVVVWTAGIDPKIFSDLSPKFNKYLGRSDMKIVVQNFASFDDYIDIVLRALHSKEVPDLVMIPNHGGYRFFEQYVNFLDDTVVDFADFETRFHKLFFEELVFSETIKEDGQNKIVQGLRGVPFGFEPMGIYYNRALVTKVPTLWETFEEILKIPETEVDVPDPENKNVLTVSTQQNASAERPAFTNMGYGKATTASPDIIALMTFQKKGPNFNSYTTVNSIDSRAIFEYYLSFRREPNNLDRFKAHFDDTLTTTDLFVRGKIATLIGYPSTYEDIKIAMQRASEDHELAPDFLKNLRIATVPQEEIDPKKQVNFAKYPYLALTRNGQNRNIKEPQNDPVLKLTEFLLTEEAQEIFSKSQNYMLPTQNGALAEKKDNKINPDDNFNMTVGDWYVPGQKFALYDMGLPHLFRPIVKKAIDEPGTTATLVTNFVSTYITCKIGQLGDSLQYPHSCLCQNALPANRNNYWPLCSQE